MIVGLPYLDAYVWRFIGIFLVISSFGEIPTQLQYQTNQNHNKSYQLVKST